MYKQLLSSALLALAGSLSAHAALIDNDTYTTDTATQLDWLDVTATTNLSYNYVKGQLNAGRQFDGWRFATIEEVNQLVTNAGTTTVTGVGDTTLAEDGNHSAADVLTMLLGSTLDVSYLHSYGQTMDAKYGHAEGDYFDYTRGFVADPSGRGGDYQTLYSIYDSDQGPLSRDYVSSAEAQLNYNYGYAFGSYLVRESASVAEPATIAIFSLGLLGLVRLRRVK